MRTNGLAVAEEDEEEATALRQQNQELRAVIHEMRREMERVSKEQASDGETAGGYELGGVQHAVYIHVLIHRLRAVSRDTSCSVEVSSTASNRTA